MHLMPRRRIKEEDGEAKPEGFRCAEELKMGIFAGMKRLLLSGKLVRCYQLILFQHECTRRSRVGKHLSFLLKCYTCPEFPAVPSSLPKLCDGAAPGAQPAAGGRLCSDRLSRRSDLQGRTRPGAGRGIRSSSASVATLFRVNQRSLLPLALRGN